MQFAGYPSSRRRDLAEAHCGWPFGALPKGGRNGQAVHL